MDFVKAADDILGIFMEEVLVASYDFSTRSFPGDKNAGSFTLNIRKVSGHHRKVSAKMAPWDGSVKDPQGSWDLTGIPGL